MASEPRARPGAGVGFLLALLATALAGTLMLLLPTALCMALPPPVPLGAWRVALHRRCAAFVADRWFTLAAFLLESLVPLAVVGDSAVCDAARECAGAGASATFRRLMEEQAAAMRTDPVQPAVAARALAPPRDGLSWRRARAA